MGLLSLGTPLDWPETQALANHIREHGVTQLLHLWNKIKGRKGDKVLWGDEIEYIVVSFDHEGKNARLSLRQGEILKVLAQTHEHSVEMVGGDSRLKDQIPTFHPEYGRYMLESTPGCPYGASPRELTQVEVNMRMRRRTARRHLKENELPITLTSFPRLGVTDRPFLDDETLVANGKASQSLFLPDEIINQHARFPTLTANIRKRRGSKVAINLPIYKDENTPSPFIDPAIPWDRDWFPGDSEAKNGAAKPDHIYMDSMGFGMGCCCLQVTFQACSIHEARSTYDQLVPVTPLLLALTAASPAYRGYLADVDARWNVISGAVDDRTPEERGLKPLKDNKTGSRMLMQKSRYDSVDSYLSLESANRPEYNDNPLPVDEGIRDRLISEGMDPLLATHFAHLFIRDPLVIFSEMIDQDDENSMDHFENIQSTNWQTMRFKPPPPGGQIGWRVEVRSMEVQITDFENAAFSVFVVLLTRAILSFRLNFYMPISKVDVNMDRAQQRDAVNKKKFYFRKDVFRSKSRHTAAANGGSSSSSAAAASQANGTSNGDASSSSSSTPSPPTPAAAALSASQRARLVLDERLHTPGSSRAGSPHPTVPVEEEYAEFTLDELINGSSKKGQSSGSDSDSEDECFPGLLSLVISYLDALNIDVETRRELNLYLDLVSQRASGKIITTATWIRNYITQHPSYKKDSVVSSEICYDMIKRLDGIERGEIVEPQGKSFLPASYAERRKFLEKKENGGKSTLEERSQKEGTGVNPGNLKTSSTLEKIKPIVEAASAAVEAAEQRQS
ncbi:unnamed protein product [Sympodiomycopsis kandeliae]